MVFLKKLLELLILAQVASGIGVENKLNLYERKRVAIDDHSDKVTLYLGLDKNLVSAEKKEFKIDFAYDELLVQSDFACDSRIQCKTLSFDEKIDKYGDVDYRYYQALTFVSFYRISPAEIPNETQKKMAIVPFRYFTKSLSNLQSVIGLGPNSKTWEIWNEIFFFRNSIFNVTFSYDDSYKFIRFYSKIEKTDAMMSVSKAAKFYSFNSNFLFSEVKKKINVCVDTKSNLHFIFTQDVYDQVISQICIDQKKCFTKSDLKKGFEKLEFKFEFTSDQIKSLSVTLNFKLTKLITFDKNNNVLFGFAVKLQPDFTNCDVIFQKSVFREYYFLISNDFKDKDFLHAGFRKIGAGDFFLLNLWIYLLLLILAILSIYAGLKITSKIRKNKTRDHEDSEYKKLDQNVSGKEA